MKVRVQAYKINTFFFAPEKIPRVNIKESKLMGFPEDSEQEMT